MSLLITLYFMSSLLFKIQQCKSLYDVTFVVNIIVTIKNFKLLINYKCITNL